MGHPVTQYAFLNNFTCTGSACVDTCCTGWGLPADKRQTNLYREKAPELLETVDTAEGIMKRDPSSGNCFQLVGGLCRIHSNYGSEFLGDSCHFYPRVLRRIGASPRMAANLSCPEVTRLVLESPSPFAITDTSLDRLPTQMPNPIPGGITADHADQLTARFLAYVMDEAPSAEHALASLVSLSTILESHAPDEWPEMASNHLEIAASHAYPAEAKPSDSYRLLYALALLIMFGPATNRARLMQTIATMESALHCHLEWEEHGIKTDPTATVALSALRNRWEQGADEYCAPILRRWLGAELATMAFPFGGFPAITLSERMRILSVRFATVKLALMCHMDEAGNPPDQDTTIRIIQSLARFMDHLADAELSLEIYRDAGWNDPARLNGLIFG